MWWLETLSMNAQAEANYLISCASFSFALKTCQTNENENRKASIPAVVPLLCQVTNSSKWTPITISEDGKRWDGSLLLFLLYCSLQFTQSIAWHLFFQVSTWRRRRMLCEIKAWQGKVPDGVILDVVAHLTSIRYCRYSLVQFGKNQRVIHGLFRKSLNDADAGF